MKGLRIKKKFYQNVYKKDIVIIDNMCAWDFDFKGLLYECYEAYDGDI